MNTRSRTNKRTSTRISNQPEKFSDIQISLNNGKYHGHVDTYERHQIQLEVSNYLEKQKPDGLHGYSNKDGFVVADQMEDPELSFDSDYDEESVNSDDDSEDEEIQYWPEEEDDLDSESESEEEDDEE
jgi:hypothetical protein